MQVKKEKIDLRLREMRKEISKEDRLKFLERQIELGIIIYEKTGSEVVGENTIELINEYRKLENGEKIRKNKEES